MRIKLSDLLQVLRENLGYFQTGEDPEEMKYDDPEKYIDIVGQYTADRLKRHGIDPQTAFQPALDLLLRQNEEMSLARKIAYRAVEILNPEIQRHR